jgi:chitodextrinase
VAANNIFAYNVTTGDRLESFSHSLNAQGLFVTASPDGSRIYVAGDFTTVDGLNRGHIAAFNTSDGSLVSSFAPSLSGSTAAIAVSPTTVYVGGNFTRARGVDRIRLAAFSPANGALLPWAPSADNGRVAAMVMAPDNSRVIVGGMFTTLNGQSANGMGSLDATSGANLPWAANQTILDGGTGSSITALRADGAQIYGSGYAYHTGRFEGSFAANPLTGAIIWANDCHGDTHDVFPVGQDLYTVSHAHDCSWIGSFPESKPRSINARHALAFTTYPTTTNKGPDNYGWNYNGVPASSLLHWFPVVTPGSYTGQNQAAWSVNGNSNYVVLGGEFPKVNGVAQQGLTRFAVANLAPNKRRPVLASGATTSATAASTGTVKVAWRAAYDMDNTTLRYDVFRSGTTNPVFTTSLDSNHWTTPAMSFTDTGLSSGATYTYTIKATDPFGNILTMPVTNSVTVG